MSKKRIQVGMLGCGEVGTGVRRVFDQITFPDVELKVIAVKDPRKRREVEAPGEITARAEDVLNNPHIDIVIELVGRNPEMERGWLLHAIRGGKSIVTANKALVSSYGSEILKEADKQKVHVGFEAAVGGGIPIIEILRRRQELGEVRRIVAIINSTTNFILTKMTKKRWTYKQALREAQKRKIAEHDPSADVMGRDAAQKLAILAWLAFDTVVREDDIYKLGITEIEPADILFAENFNYVIKLVAMADGDQHGLELMVSPVLLFRSHPQLYPLAEVSDEYNAILIDGEFSGLQMFYGKGAGEETASAVITDVLRIARNLQGGAFGPWNQADDRKLSIRRKEEIQRRAYFRMYSDNVPGNLGAVATTIGRHRINILEFQQIRELETGKTMPIILTTDPCALKTVNKALQDLGRLEGVRKKPKPFFMPILK